MGFIVSFCLRELLQKSNEVIYLKITLQITFFSGIIYHYVQETAREKMNILGISELKWTGMGGFNSDDHYIYY